MDIDGKLYCPKCMRETEHEGVCPHCGYDPAQKPPVAALGMGTLLNDRYQLGAVIGQGGFGITYAAWDELLGRPVAIKEYFPADYCVRNTELSDEVETTEKARAIYLDGMLRFQRESHLLAELQGIPEIVKVLDFFSENNTAYIVMEFIRGLPVDRWVREKKLKTDDILKLMRPAINALVSTHRQGVLHRDLTPSNILVQEDGSIKLIDFGSATTREQSKGTIMLTRKYAPIEQYGSEHGAQGPWTDVYGISAVLYALLCNEEPQEAVQRIYGDKLKTLKKQKVSIKKYQNAAIMEGLQVRPENRIQSMDELRSRLYNLPLPEAILRHQRAVRRIGIASALAFVILSVLAANFSVGLPLGQGLMYSLRSDGWHIKGEMVEKAERELPEKRLGVRVSQIDSGAFRKDKSLAKVSIPGSVHTIGDSAFYGCGSLESVTLDENVKSIGAAAFAECSRLETVFLPESLDRIDDTAFFNVSQSASLLVHEGSAAHQWAVKTGTGYVCGLKYQVNGEEICISAVADTEGNIVLPSRLEGKKVTAISEGVQLLAPQRVRLPEGLVRIPDYMFTESSITEVYLGSSLEVIGEVAFGGAEKLQSIRLPDSVHVIDDGAFYYTPSLKHIEIGDQVTYIGDSAFRYSGIGGIDLPSSVETIGQSAFADTKLDHITIAEGVKTIPSWCFYQTEVETVLLPGTVEEIEPDAFMGSSIQYIEIPASVKYIGTSAFENCAHLKLVYAPGKGRIEIAEQALSKNSRDMVIAARSGTGWKRAAENSACQFSDIETWAVPAFMEEGIAHFEIAGLGSDVIVPMYDEINHLPVSGIAFIGSADDCAMESVLLPPFMSAIEMEAFRGFETLKSVRSAGRITLIGAFAFSGCVRLETFPSAYLEKIGAFAFENCDSLTTVSLPDSLVQIDDGAFDDASSLASVRLPRNERLVYAQAPFANTAITELVIPGNIPYISPIVYGMGQLKRLVCEEGVVSLMDDQSLYDFDCPMLEELWLPSTLRGGLDYDEFNGYTVFGEHLTDIYIYNDRMYIDPDVFCLCRDHLTIHAHEGSSASLLAKREGIRFAAIEAGMSMPPNETILVETNTGKN